MKLPINLLAISTTATATATSSSAIRTSSSFLAPHRLHQPGFVTTKQKITPLFSSTLSAHFSRGVCHTIASCSPLVSSLRATTNSNTRTKRTKMSASTPTTSSANNNTDDIGDIASSSPPPPLIDVDCNLIHADMMDLSRNGIIDNGKKDDNDNKQHNFDLLKHESIRKSNIIGMFSPSSTIKESELSLDTFDAYYNNNHYADLQHKVDIKTSVGVHPYHAEEEGDPHASTTTTDGESKLTQLVTLIERGLKPKQNQPPSSSSNGSILACIGECGLDYSPGFPPPSAQIPWFDAQLDLAYKYDLPLFVHERLAFDDVLKSISQAESRHPNKPSPKIIVHCFTGNATECKTYIDKGYYIGITGFIHKPNGNEVRNILKSDLIPLDKLMIETDAPYMGFANCRDLFLESEDLTSLNSKKRKRLQKGIYPNVPASLPLVLKGVVDAMNEGREERQETLLSEDYVARICSRNAMEFFGFDFGDRVEV